MVGGIVRVLVRVLVGLVALWLAFIVVLLVWGLFRWWGLLGLAVAVARAASMIVNDWRGKDG